MMDDLNAPGTGPTGRRATLFRGVKSPSLAGWLLGAVGAIALVILGWIVLVDDPLGGEPVAILPLDRTSGPADIGETLSLRPAIDFRDAQSVPSAD